MEPQEKKPISNFSFLDAVSEIFLEALSFSISRKWLKRVSNTAFETRPPVETPINASFKHKGQLRHGLMLLWFTDLMNVLPPKKRCTTAFAIFDYIIRRTMLMLPASQ